jgi:hypothetical protein
VTLAMVVDWGALGKVVLYSFVAGIGLTTVLSFGIVGLVRFDDTRRGTRAGSRVGYAALALVSGLIIAVAVVEAIIIMAQK